MTFDHCLRPVAPDNCRFGEQLWVALLRIFHPFAFHLAEHWVSWWCLISKQLFLFMLETERRATGSLCGYTERTIQLNPNPGHKLCMLLLCEWINTLLCCLLCSDPLRMSPLFTHLLMWFLLILCLPYLINTADDLTSFNHIYNTFAPAHRENQSPVFSYRMYLVLSHVLSGESGSKQRTKDSERLTRLQHRLKNSCGAEVRVFPFDCTKIACGL